MNPHSSWTQRVGCSPHVLLTPQQMAQADAVTIAGGLDGRALMEAAGAAVARAVQARWPRGEILVLCGAGNNGGDGFVAARHLHRAGRRVRVALFGERARLRGDAAWASGRWEGPVAPAEPAALAGAEVVVDALLGAGLSRPLEGPLLELVTTLNAARLAVCSVDVPTGVDGGSGACAPAAVQAALTVTFFRRKPGHVLLPGRLHCGVVRCVPIGIEDAVLAGLGAQTWRNDPGLWGANFPWPQPGDHKYRRGQVLMVGSAQYPGASRLACLAAARIGAGLVTLAVPREAWAVQAAALTSVMVETLPDDGDVSTAVRDPRRNALLIGPGLGRTATARAQVLALLATRRPCVLDADALSAFADQRPALAAALHPDCVLSPHEGEFAALFPDLSGPKPERARAAARAVGAVVIIKGADTVIAAPDGRCVINDNAPATLATAGSGDVLSGCVAGLLAAHMVPFEAACVAVWLHGAAARTLGFGLLAEDLPGALPAALQALADAHP